MSLSLTLSDEEKHMNSQLKPFIVKNVLLVDADEETRDLLSNVFKPGEWAIHHAPNNLTALAMARVRVFDLILTSEKTSGREDVELLRKIRVVRPHTRLIILTNESAPADVIDAMREHAFSYFSPPYALDVLSDMVHKAVEEPCWDDGIEITSATPEWIRVMVRCDRKTAERVLQFFNEIADLPEPERSAVGMAFREMLLNAIEHGGGLDPTKNVEIAYVRARHMITCQINDPGPGFTLDEIPHAAIAHPAEDPLGHVVYREAQGMRPGGFGVLLAQKLVDQLIYGQDGNEVLLVKYLDPKPVRVA
jgi:anti-sigma regulatory factor (Ser/Thr protein kinase)/DNA-binding NarL/FixJ family response regulator